ncbi:hypothetical protein OQA87_22510 [Yersinia intermedia]|nr:hypothetical protein [Yersinia intermedia]MCW8114301.1 hypothetical protein [Yersinia intermedia]
MFPDGLTEVTNNSVVALTQSPNQFLVSTSGMILQDLDQDSGLSTTINSASISWVWEVDGLPLTVEQLASSFNTNFSGKTLNVAATAP